MAYTTSILQLAAAFLISSSLLLPADANYGYGGRAPNPDGHSADLKIKPSLPIGVQGTILCKLFGSDDGSGYRPIQGASARITCVAEDEHGYETAPFSASSTRTNDKGYYFATLYLSGLMMSDEMKLKVCKAFLENSSPSDNCNYPTDENGGVAGAVLTSHSILEEKQMMLYTVKPFAYSTTAGPASAPLPADGYDYDGY